MIIEESINTNVQYLLFSVLSTCPSTPIKAAAYKF